AAAVGTITEGYGRFRGHVGTYTYCGVVTADAGFRGNLMLRVMDPRDELCARGAVTRGNSGSPLEPGETYLVFRGEKSGRGDRTEYRFGSGGRIEGLLVGQQLRALDVDLQIGRPSQLDSLVRFGPLIGRMTADINFDLLNPGPATAMSPSPF